MSCALIRPSTAGLDTPEKHGLLDPPLRAVDRRISLRAVDRRVSLRAVLLKIPPINDCIWLRWTGAERVPRRAPGRARWAGSGAARETNRARGSGRGHPTAGESAW